MPPVTQSQPPPSPDDDATQFPRVATGNAEVDRILGGGFPANSINIVMGQPGTGKSILVEQMVFHNASGERPILYLTTLSEPVVKVVRYLQRFSFYDEEKLGTAVQYEDIGADLGERGISALLARVTEAITTDAPKIIVIDSFKALHDLAPSVTEMRKMLYELTGLLTAYETTVFLVGEYTEEHARTLPEFAVCDGILQLMRREFSTRDERFLRVLKLRGSGYLEGVHGFRITPGGLVVYPRLVSPDVPEDYELELARIPTGVEGLDAVLQGGFLRGSTTLLAGPTGAGKTTVALQFALEGVKRGEASLYVNFQENPTQLARTIRGLGVDFDEARRNGLHLLYASPVELQIDSIIVTLFRAMEAHNVRRVVIDALGDLSAASEDAGRIHDYLYALVQHFAVRGVTSILNFETSQYGLTSLTTDQGRGRFSFVSDNILVLGMEMEPTLRRTLFIVKARNTHHDLAIRTFTIGHGGARVV